MHGFNHRVELAEEISVGIQADVESQGTELTTAEGQITTATTTTLVTASAGKKILVKRIEFSVDVDQAIAAAPFKVQVVNNADVAKIIHKPWNPKTGAVYGKNVAPDYNATGTAKTVQIITPTGFTDKLDWVLDYQEVDA